ncbi:hypothetical protein BGZ59_002948 [Podila verticillata]|uniref:Ig-like domain-containing protein n=1 Tax=Podila verticillata NRRL 6337 TaxID=1069443 RepID=A0A086TJ25_9FUNG|nr:hypothetical protein BGZ59_002948 [Podila verticillata]KFH61952.1 hypothetical protein MVEG_12106 [Podila verticillata NRRL 6337]
MHFSKALLLCAAYVASTNAISLPEWLSGVRSNPRIYSTVYVGKKAEGVLVESNAISLHGCFSGSGSSPRIYSTVYACKKADGVLIGSGTNGSPYNCVLDDGQKKTWESEVSTLGYTSNCD